MAYKQLVTPNINIGATRGWCLGYVDNAINAVYPYRSYSAQIAYNTAKAKGWVTANQNYPRNVWFVLFWSIDNGQYAGLGHVALAYVDSSGNMQIHDSEVHANARKAYRSVSELASWFGSVGTRMTYLGWSIGCDNVQLIESITAKKEDVKTETTKINQFGGISMFTYQEKGSAGIYGVWGNKTFGFSNPQELKDFRAIVKDTTGRDCKHYTWTKGQSPFAVVKKMVG